LIDEEVKIIIDAQYERAKKVLKDNKEGHTKLADLLLEREVIFSEDLENIFGKRPWDKNKELPENGTDNSIDKNKEIAEKTEDRKEEEIKSELTDNSEESKSISA
jgi:cell division protease FtsH